jgi:lipoprotein-anchoring transpeptidase ErfK/SrfK
MTVVALFGVAVLAAQAARAAPKVADTARAGSKSAAQTTVSTTVSPAAGGSAANANALPANSGSGNRVVYSENGQRVWLVGADGSSVERTFQVVPGTIAAPTGTYSVTRKEPGATGSDGTPVQYVVLFGQRVVSGTSTTFGFDAVANVTGLPPKPTSRTGGVRMAQLDAQALFNFVSVGSNVTVVN